MIQVQVDQQQSFESCKDTTVYGHPDFIVDISVFNHGNCISDIIIWNDMECEFPDCFNNLTTILNQIKDNNELIFNEEIEN